MWVLLTLFVINFFQGTVLCIGNSNHVFKRSPQQFDIQSIRQKQISPDITVVDVVVNEPVRNGYGNRNQFVQPVYQPTAYPRPTNTFNYNPNGIYQNNIPQRRQPDIKIIEIVDPNPRVNSNLQPWQMYPGGNQRQMYPTGTFPGNNQEQFDPNFTGQFPGNGNRPHRRRRPHRRPYRPTPDFFVTEDSVNDELPPPRRPPLRDDKLSDREGPRRRPKPNKDKQSDDDSEEDNDKYIFDQGDNTVVGYTKDNFPIVPLQKKDIRR